MKNLNLLSRLGFGPKKPKDPFEEFEAIKAGISKLIHSELFQGASIQKQFQIYNDCLDNNSGYIIDTYNRASQIDEVQAFKTITGIIKIGGNATYNFYGKLWDSETSRNHFNSALKALPDKDHKFKVGAYFSTIRDIVPNGSQPEFLQDHADALNPLIAKGHFSPFLLMLPLTVNTPKNTVDTLRCFESSISVFFALPPKIGKSDPTENSVFMIFALDAYQQAEEPVPAYLSAARIAMRDAAITNIFNAEANVHAGAKFITHENLQTLTIIHQKGDPITSVDDKKIGARLIRLENPTDVTDKLLILCQKDGESLTPVFMDRSLMNMMTALKIKASALDHPIHGLTVSRLSDMGRQLGYDS